MAIWEAGIFIGICSSSERTRRKAYLATFSFIRLNWVYGKNRREGMEDRNRWLVVVWFCNKSTLGLFSLYVLWIETELRGSDGLTWSRFTESTDGVSFRNHRFTKIWNREWLNPFIFDESVMKKEMKWQINEYSCF